MVVAYADDRRDSGIEYRNQNPRNRKAEHQGIPRRIHRVDPLHPKDTEAERKYDRIDTAEHGIPIRLQGVDKNRGNRADKLKLLNVK